VLAGAGFLKSASLSADPPFEGSTLLSQGAAVAARILVCDNEEPIRALVRAALGGDYEVLEARDGDESLELVRRERPELIVLDMMMPGRSGLDVLAELRGDAVASHTPVIMLTARTQVSDHDAATEAGADRFVGKPFSPAALADLVDELLAGRT
jgi:DNA-binding response OmpR family regulator